jgi:hypothetical protein
VSRTRPRRPGRCASDRAVLTPLRGFPGPNLPVRAFVADNAMLNGFVPPVAAAPHPTELRAHKAVCVTDAASASRSLCQRQGSTHAAARGHSRLFVEVTSMVIVSFLAARYGRCGRGIVCRERFKRCRASVRGSTAEAAWRPTQW